MTKILVVDDDVMLRKLFGKRLENAGFEVCYASNGVMGLEVAYNVMPDIILLDFQMPEMTGDEMLQILRDSSWGQSIPVIMMSATRSIKFLPNIDQATDLLFKPIIGKELVNSVRNLLLCAV